MPACGSALRRVDEFGLYSFGQTGHGISTRHHGPDDAPVAKARARPQRAVLDHRQKPGMHQRGFSGTAMALNLQPAMVAVSITPVQLIGRGLLLIAEAGQRLQSFSAPAKEQLGVLAFEGAKTEEWAALETRA